jgi:hypothetical protein
VKHRVSTKVKGVIYTLHFSKPVGTDQHYAQHYTGFTSDLHARLAAHAAGKGARLIEVLKERGIGWELADVHPGNRDMERLLKQHSATRRCPICTPDRKLPQVVQVAIDAEERRKVREARKAAREAKAEETREVVLAPKAAPTNAERYARGASHAVTMVMAHINSGWTADQIERVYEQITAPFYDAPRKPHQLAQMRGFQHQIDSDLALLRELEREDEEARAQAMYGRSAEADAPAAEREAEAG